MECGTAMFLRNKISIFIAFLFAVPAYGSLTYGYHGADPELRQLTDRQLKDEYHDNRGLTYTLCEQYPEDTMSPDDKNDMLIERVLIQHRETQINQEVNERAVQKALHDKEAENTLLALQRKCDSTTVDLQHIDLLLKTIAYQNAEKYKAKKVDLEALDVDIKDSEKIYNHMVHEQKGIVATDFEDDFNQSGFVKKIINLDIAIQVNAIDSQALNRTFDYNKIQHGIDDENARTASQKVQWNKKDALQMEKKSYFKDALKEYYLLEDGDQKKEKKAVLDVAIKKEITDILQGKKSNKDLWRIFKDLEEKDKREYGLFLFDLLKTPASLKGLDYYVVDSIVSALDQTKRNEQSENFFKLLIQHSQLFFPFDQYNNTSQQHALNNIVLTMLETESEKLREPHALQLLNTFIEKGKMPAIYSSHVRYGGKIVFFKYITKNGMQNIPLFHNLQSTENPKLAQWIDTHFEEIINVIGQDLMEKPAMSEMLVQVHDFMNAESKKGNAVLFHGQQSKWLFKQEIFRRLYELKKGTHVPDNFKFVRYTLDPLMSSVQASLIRNNGLEDYKKEPNRIMFTNLIPYANEDGSNSFHYAANNIDQSFYKGFDVALKDVFASADMKAEFEYLQEHSADKLVQLEKQYKKAIEEQGDCGTLIGISIPKEKINSIAYPTQYEGWFLGRNFKGDIMKVCAENMDELDFRNQYALILSEDVTNPAKARASNITMQYFHPANNTEQYLIFLQQLEELMTIVKEQHEKHN